LFLFYFSKSKEKTARSEKGGFLKIRRKCFLVSTAEDLNSSQLDIYASDEKIISEKVGL